MSDNSSSHAAGYTMSQYLYFASLGNKVASPLFVFRRLLPYSIAMV